MAKRDFYEVLGLRKGADDQTIRKAYRKLAKKYHPDSNPGDQAAEQKFKEVTEAYNVLSDKEKKKLYDQFGMAAFEEGAQGAYQGAGDFGGFNGFGAGAGYAGRGAGNSGWQEMHFSGDASDVNMDDILKNLFGSGFGKAGFSGGYSSENYGSGGYSSGRYGSDGYGSGFGSGRGQDVESQISVSFDEAAFGADKTVQISGPGAGGRRQSLKIHIPAGIDEGKKIRLRGKGQPGRGGAENGDLLLRVHILPKEGYERQGMDVYTTVSVPFTTAVFGGEAVVSTLYGDVVCKVPAGTQSGSRIRLKGKGIVSMKDKTSRGDQYVTVQIQVPRSLTPQARRKLKEFEEACGQGKSSQA